MPISPESRKTFEEMGLDRVRIDLLRGFDIPKGYMRKEALEWITEQERIRDRRARRGSTWLILLTAIAAIGALLAAIADYEQLIKIAVRLWSALLGGTDE